MLSSVNSAAGAGRRVESLRQAIVLVGRRTLSAWAMLAVLGSAGLHLWCALRSPRRQTVIERWAGTVVIREGRP